MRARASRSRRLVGILVVSIGLLTIAPSGVSQQSSSLSFSDSLTAQERTWLADHGPIRIAVTDVPPAMVKTAEGDWQGWAVEMARLTEIRLGLEVRYVEFPDIPSYLASVATGSADIIPIWIANPEIASYALPSRATAWIPHIAVTTDAHPEFRDLATATGRVGLFPLPTIQASVTKMAPHLEQIIMPNATAAVDLLAKGELEAFVGPLPATGWAARNHPDLSIRAIGEPLLVESTSMWGSKDNATAIQIIDKGLAFISPNEARVIYLKWAGFDLSEPGVDGDQTAPGWLWPVLAALVLGTILVGVWVFALRRTVHRRTIQLRESIDELAQVNANLEDRVAARTQEALETNERALLLNSKLQDMMNEQRSFMAVLGHELRTPLNSILGSAYVLLEQVADSVSRQRLHTLASSSEHLASLLQDLMDLARLEAGKMTLEAEPIDFLEVIEEAMEIVAGDVHDEPIQVNYSYICGPERFCQGDPTRLRQVMLNLLNNAINHAPGKLIEVDVRVASGRFHIRVDDSGTGIAPELRDSLFDAFVRDKTSRSTPGAGLGLAIAKRLAELMGGTIVVARAPSGGARFEVELPFKESTRFPEAFVHEGVDGQSIGIQITPPAAASHVKNLLQRSNMKPTDDPNHPVLATLTSTPPLGENVDPKQPELWVTTPTASNPTRLEGPITRARLVGAILAAAYPDSHRMRRSRFDPNLATRSPMEILAVDDDEPNIRTIRNLLDAFGYQCDTTMSGADAIIRASERHYDLILMDIEMRDTDGIAATQAILAQGAPKPRIVALTAHLPGEIDKDFSAAGMDGRISKPIAPEALGELLRETARRKKESETPPE